MSEHLAPWLMFLLLVVLVVGFCYEVGRIVGHALAPLVGLSE
jgi:hypothetical protein